jgi:hypothetical protein
MDTTTEELVIGVVPLWLCPLPNVDGIPGYRETGEVLCRLRYGDMKPLRIARHCDHPCMPSFLCLPDAARI